MRSTVTGFATLFMAIFTFITMANIQFNADANIEIETAANEAAYATMTTLLYDDTIKTDADMREEFMRESGLLLEGIKNI